MRFRIALAIVLCQTWLVATSSAQDRYDTILQGGRVLDGSGNPFFHADVGIKDGRIARIGASAKRPPTR
ncbi:MAG: hypothetical protein ACRD3V_34530 [Vicinamibacteria bacterium]